MTGPSDERDDFLAETIAADVAATCIRTGCTCAPKISLVSVDYDPLEGGRYSIDLHHRPGCGSIARQQARHN